MTILIGWDGSCTPVPPVESGASVQLPPQLMVFFLQIINLGGTEHTEISDELRMMSAEFRVISSVLIQCYSSLSTLYFIFRVLRISVVRNPG